MYELSCTRKIQFLRSVRYAIFVLNWLIYWYFRRFFSIHIYVNIRIMYWIYLAIRDFIFFLSYFDTYSIIRWLFTYSIKFIYVFSITMVLSPGQMDKLSFVLAVTHIGKSVRMFVNKLFLQNFSWIFVMVRWYET